MIRRRQLASLGILLSILTGCHSKEQTFSIQGTISGAQDKWIYLEDIGTGNVMAIDSTKIKPDGSFQLSHLSTEYPMFYRLVFNNESVPFVAVHDTKLEVKSTLQHFFRDFQFVKSDAENDKIRQISLLRNKADLDIDHVISQYHRGFISNEAARAEVSSIFEKLKKQLAEQFIYTEPKSASAYFALFQKKGDTNYFSIDDPGDEKTFAAVATSYDVYYPDAPYTPFLKDLALKAMAQAKVRKEMQRQKEEFKNFPVETISFPDIQGVDQHEEQIDLRQLASQSKVLISFTAYGADWSPEIIARLKKYQEQHPEVKILELSLDPDSFIYRNVSRNLPWSSLHDPSGTIARKYNINNLPTFYIIQNGDLKRLNSLR